MTATPTLTPLAREILARIQTGFPLRETPYLDLGNDLGCSEEEALQTVNNLRDTGIIRRIGGSFSAQALGYLSVLVAARVEPEHIRTAAERAGAFPEVTHNYERDSIYNLWFTVIAPTRIRLETILETVRETEGVLSVHELPALRLFKIRVDFPLTEGSPPANQESGNSGSPLETRLEAYACDDLDRKIIRRVCGDIGRERTPFRSIAEELGIEQSELLSRLENYRRHGAMRRFGAVLRHQRAGFGGNGMSVWNVPAGDLDRVGRSLAASPYVSHCYERPRFADWPYNLFAMVHGHDRRECLALTRELADIVGINEYSVLFSTREFKKSSMVYFPEADTEQIP